MATLALMAVGGAIGGGIGGTVAGIAAATIGSTIGAVLGGVLDSYVIYPAIFRQDRDLRGPRLADLRLQTAVEGADVKWCVGPTNRVAGNLIWLTDLIETANESDVGGKGGGGATQTNYSYSVNVAIGVCEGPIQAIRRIWADSKVIYDNGGVDARYTSLRVYLGDSAQQADPLIQSYQGAANTPAFRGTAYVVIEGLQLADWGNRLPQFTFLVEQDAAVTVRDAFDAVLRKANLRSTVYNTADLAAHSGTFRGLTASGPQSTAKLLEVLMLAYDVSARESGGVITFFRRSEGPTYSVDPRDVAAHEFGSQGVRAFTMTDSSGKDLAKKITVRFVEPAFDYQDSAQSEALINHRNPINTVLDLPLVLTAAEARAIAQRVLWSTWAERIKGQASLAPYHLTAEEGDIITVTDGTESYQVLVTQADLGWNMINEIKGLVIETQTFDGDFDTPDDDPAGDPGTVTEPVTALTVEFMNLPPLRDQDVQQPGFYIAAAPTNPAETWAGATLYAGTSSTNTAAIRSISGPATMGTALTQLLVGPTNVIDSIHQVDVELIYGTLENATDAEISAGKNWALIGNEIIAFQIATLIGPNQYRLSNLYRGLRDTVDSWEISNGHVPGERFVLLQPTYVNFNSINVGNIGQGLYYKVVPKYGVPASYPVISFTPTGETVVPFRPVNFQITGSNGNGGDVTFSWDRQSRWLDRPFSGANGPLDEPFERFELIINPNGKQVFVDGRTWTYTVAMQQADGMLSDPVGPGPYPTYSLNQLWQVGSFFPRGNRQPPQ